ncbi:MAG: hypothetical protein P8Y39_00380 [Nitrospirota bacterium]
MEIVDFKNKLRALAAKFERRGRYSKNPPKLVGKRVFLRVLPMII